MTPRSSMAGRSAFTLIEMLAAVTILLTISAMLILAFLQAQRSWSHGERRANALQEGRRLLSTIANDLQTAYTCSNNGNIFFRGDATHLYFASAISDSNHQQTNVNASELTELSWIGYEYDNTTRVLLRRTVPPLGAQVTLWRNHIYGSDTTGYDVDVLASNTVVDCWFSRVGDSQRPRAVRIHVEIVDPLVAKQYQATGSVELLNENKRVLETLVYLFAGP